MEDDDGSGPRGASLDVWNCVLPPRPFLFLAASIATGRRQLLAGIGDFTDKMRASMV